MVKVLISGDICGEWSLLVARVNALEASSHGPFHCLLLAGKAFENINEYKEIKEKVNFPIPTYFYDLSNINAEELNPFPKNLHLLQSSCESSSLFSNIGGIVTMSQYLTVAYFNSVDSKAHKFESASHGELLKDMSAVCNVPNYRGCDLYLSSDWPKDVQYFIDDAENELLKQSGAGVGIGSPIATQIANICKPRYHIGCGRNAFFQRSPYKNVDPDASDHTSMFRFPCTRFVSLASISDSKDKNKKWLHALSLEPIIHMTTADITEQPANTTDNPYVSINSKTLSSRPNPPPPPLPRASHHPSNQQNPGSFFFGSNGAPSHHLQQGTNNAGAATLVLTPPTPDAKRLFIGGLTREINEHDIKQAIPGCLFVKRPQGKAFAFVEFETHKMASKVLDAATRRGLNIRGRTLTVGWAAQSQPQQPLDPNSKRQREDNNPSESENIILIPPSESSQTLFVSNLPMEEFNDKELLDVLGPGAEAVTRIQSKKGFVFVECSSFAAAESILSSSLSAPNPSTEESASTTRAGFLFKGNTLTLGWAKGKQQREDGDSNKRRKLGLCLQAPSTDAKTLFVGGVAAATADSDLENLFVGILHGSQLDKSSISQTPMLSIRRPDGKDFAFIEFPTPRDAQTVMDRVSTDSTGESGVVLHGKEITIGWAKGRPADAVAVSSHAGDCWFCLASETVKVKLIKAPFEKNF